MDIFMVVLCILMVIVIPNWIWYKVYKYHKKEIDAFIKEDIAKDEESALFHRTLK
ncbi:hypothetical protein [Streptococcus bovimastitidis]|uniref:hypothetical protein n=1 Tax=Streptococcus bovimastitidis TaxID=1856638 RepID=UPI0013F4DC3A|nr:hypothetical protein [Streptococcus bovimastitidis]